MKMLTLTAGLVAAFASWGCAGGAASGGNAKAAGLIYQGYTAPGLIGTGAAADKRGEACASSVLGYVAFGDASLTAAKAAGGITSIGHVDHTVFNILGLYASSCTVVRGS